VLIVLVQVLEDCQVVHLMAEEVVHEGQVSDEAGLGIKAHLQVDLCDYAREPFNIDEAAHLPDC